MSCFVKKYKKNQGSKENNWLSCFWLLLLILLKFWFTPWFRSKRHDLGYNIQINNCTIIELWSQPNLMFSNKNRNIHAVIIALADGQFWIDRTYTNIVLLSYRIWHTNTTHLSSSAASYHHLNKFQSKKLVTLQFLMPPSKFIAYFKFSNPAHEKIPYLST